MKSYSILFLFILLFSLLSFKAVAIPTLVEGTVTNTTESKMFLSYLDSLGNHITDSSQISKNGHFEFKMNRFMSMQKVFLRFNKNFYTYLFIAPGYHLIVNADLKDGRTFKQNKTISGIGAIGNKFSFQKDSIETSLNSDIYKKSENEFLQTLQIYFEKLASNIIELDQLKKEDLALRYIMEINYLDLHFWKMQFVLDYINFNKDFSIAKRISFLKENTNTAIYSNLFDSNFVKSDKYLEIMGSGYYANYLLRSNSKVNLADLDNDELRLLIIKQIKDSYKGKIAEIALNNYMSSSVNRIESYEVLQNYKIVLEKFYVNELNRVTISSVIVKKEDELFLTRKGMPPNFFTMVDKDNKIFNLSHFNGKVIYIDLWASWCIPCREENPNIRALKEYYNNKKDFIIISLAVLDKEQDWRRALKQDQPTWNQFFDNRNEAKEVFFSNNSYSIPRFILIDKIGKIVDFNAPRPSDPKLKILINSSLD